MSARVFIHPRCTAGPALGALISVFQAHNIEGCFFAPGGRRYAELVRFVGDPQTTCTFERMDGVQFTRPAPAGPAPDYTPEAA